MKRAKWNESITFIRQYVKTSHIAILTVLSVLSSIFLVLVAFMTKLVIDAIESGDTNAIIINVCIAIALLLVYAIMQFGTSYLTTRYSMVATKKAISDSHHHLLRSDYMGVQERHSVEQLKIVANDTDIAVSTYISLFPVIAGMVVKLVAGVGLMLYISATITLIAIAVGIVLVLGLFLVRGPMKRLHKVSQRLIAISNAYMQESVKNVEVVKALDMSDCVRQGVESRLEDVRMAVEKRARVVSLMNALVYFMLEVTFLFVLVYGGSLIVTGGLVLAEFVVLISLIEVVKSPFMTATSVGTNMYNMIASAERVLTVMHLPSDEYVGDGIDKIVYDKVSYRYNDSYILKDYDLVINSGEKLAIVGYSGGGKSTIIRLLLGLITPESGAIYIEKNGVREEMGHRVLRASYVPQDIELFHDSIRNNLVTREGVTDEEIESALRLAGIYDEVMERGLDYVLGEGGDGLSQGQMQRLAIARAVLSDREIMILDEPFASLDQKVAKEIFGRLMTLDKTVIIVSHDDFVREGCPRVILQGEEHE